MGKGLKILRDFEASYFEAISEQYSFADIARRFGMSVQTQADMLCIAKTVNYCMLADILRYEPFLNLSVLGHFFNSEGEAFAFDIVEQRKSDTLYHSLCIDNCGCRLEIIADSQYEKLFGSEYRTIRDVVSSHLQDCSDIMTMADYL